MFDPIVHEIPQVLAATRTVTTDVKNFTLEPICVENQMHKAVFVGQMQDSLCFFKRDAFCYSSFYKFIGEFVPSKACSKRFVALLIGHAVFTVAKREGPD